MEPLEEPGGCEEVEVFRLYSIGGVEMHRLDIPGQPMVRLKTNGDFGNSVGIPFRADELGRFAEYLLRYAERMRSGLQSPSKPLDQPQE